MMCTQVRVCANVATPPCQLAKDYYCNYRTTDTSNIVNINKL